MKVLGNITPLYFGKRLILAMDERWKDHFVDELSFKVVINNDDKIMLIGPKISQDAGPITKPTVDTQEISTND